MGAVGFLSDLTTSVAGLFSPKPKTPDPNKARAANDAGTALLNALNLTSLTVKAADELQGGDNNNLGGAAILAFGPDQPAPGEVLGSSTEATDTPPVATSTASTSPPAVFVPDPSTVHLNAPAFDGQAASPPAESPDTTTGTGDASTTDNTASTTPDVASSTPPALTPPVITFSNWAVSDEARLCDVPPRFVDIAWNAPGATSYDIYTQDVEDQYMNLLNKTRDIGVLSFSVPVGIYRMIPTNLIVVAHNDADDAATTTVRLDTAIPDNAPPQMLSLSPALFATGVSTTTSIAVTFDEPIATSTVNDVSARMNDAARTYNVDRTVSLSLDGKTITITPTNPLAYSTRFNIALTCTISDLYGNRLPYDMGIVMDPSSQYFTTEAAPAAATSTP